MKISKVIVVVVAIIVTFAFPFAVYQFNNYSLNSRVSTPKIELRKMVDLQKKYFAIHGKYSYDLKALGYPETKEAIVGFSKICVQKMDPRAQVIRSYQISNAPQRWSLNRECNIEQVIQDNLETELFLDDLFEIQVVCLAIDKGFEATAIINSCGKYGVYRISETGEFKTIKPIADPFSYAKFFQSLINM